MSKHKALEKAAYLEARWKPITDAAEQLFPNGKIENFDDAALASTVILALSEMVNEFLAYEGKKRNAATA